MVRVLEQVKMKRLLIKTPIKVLRYFSWLFPLALIVQGFIFPNVNNRIAMGLFPAIPVGVITIRFDEIFLVAALCLWAFVLLTRLFQRKKIKTGMSPLVFVLFVGFCVLFLVGAILGIIAINSNPRALSDFRYTVLPTLYLFMVVQFFDPVHDAERFCKGGLILLTFLSISSFLSSTLPGYVRFLEVFPFSDARPNGVFSPVEILTMLKILYALTLAFYLNGDSPQIVYLLLTMIALSGQMIWFDKTTYVQIPLITLMLIVVLGRKRFFFWRSRVLKNVITLSVLFAVLLVVAIILLLPSGFVAQYVEFAVFRITRPDIGDITSGRAYMWSEALKLIVKRPLLGHGLGIVYSFPSLINQNFTSVMQEHNLPLWIAARLGLPAFFIIFLISIWYVRIGLKVLRMTRGRMQSMTAALYVFSVSMIITALIGMHLLYLNVGILFAFSCGFVIRLYWKELAVQRSLDIVQISPRIR